MKSFLACLVLLFLLPSATPKPGVSNQIKVKPASNVVVITIDGFRWQELFSGADADLISNPAYTPDTSTIRAMYWADSESERRQRLMPFFWNVLSRKGQLLGNRHFNNRVNTANIYAFSYPGYNEIFTGTTDLMVASNKKKKNSNINVLEFLAAQESFKGRIAVFTSWDVFPFIFNENRNGLPVNSGYEQLQETYPSAARDLINRVQQEAINEKGGSRYDMLTFLAAKEYIAKRQPRVVHIGLGETDEYAHHGRYDLYLEHANKIDRLIGELWNWVQNDPHYKNNTSFIITTDHGRGSRDSKWTSHSSFIKGSSQTWMALIGPGIEPLGEVKESGQYYQQEIASMIAALVGENFEPGAGIASSR